jgi:Ca-activated chloride channel homolog
MKIDANDPKWTAYALGEGMDEQEREELERILEQSSEMRLLVEGIRSAGEMLAQELHEEAAIDLTHAQRIRIREQAASGLRWFGLRPAWAISAAAAAALALVISGITLRQLRYAETDGQPVQVAELKGKEPLRDQTQARPQAETSSLPRLRTQEVNRLPDVLQKSPPATIQQTASNAEPERESNQAKALPADEPSTPAPVPKPLPVQATLAGTVTDAVGAAIPGVKVSIRDDSTGSELQAVTDEAGRYSFLSLGPGTHTVRAELPGFRASVTNIALNNAPQKLDLNLKVSSMAETVAVSVAPAISLSTGSLTYTAEEYDAYDSRHPLPSPERPGPVRTKGLLPIQKSSPQFNTEAYDKISENPFLDVIQNPLSTFSIDVDTASYSNMRRFLDAGSLPPKDSIRIEELMNYFDYDYAGPKNGKPFAVHFEITETPWNPEHRLLRIGLKGREIETGKRPAGNLVFLLDVSGSMADENKLPLVKQSMHLLVDQLTESDRVAIVVYAGNTEVLLPSTPGDQKERILRSIERLNAGGSTNGASGIQLAYRTAEGNFIKGGINRVILTTDGDFNVGITNRGDLTQLIEEKAKSGIFLSALGFGMGNYKDATMELLAKSGHGNYAYIDTLNEAKKVLVQQINSTLVPIAKDVKIQVEFNPARVSAYRLIGYEDRLMAKEDFNDDTKDAGVIGAGHAVTALYELVPPGAPIQNRPVDPLKYQKPVQPSVSADSNELVTVKIRSKEPDKDSSVLSEFVLKESKEKFANASNDFKFAAAVATVGMVLRDSTYKGSANLERALQWAQESKGEDRYGYRAEFIRLIHRAISLSF